MWVNHARKLLKTLVASASVAIAVASLAPAASASPGVPPTADRNQAVTFTGSGHGDGTTTFRRDLPDAASIRAAYARGGLTALEKATPVSAEVAVTATHNVVGDPTLTAKITAYSAVGIPLWRFQVTQSFDDNGSVVTWLSPVSFSGTSVWYPGWSLGNLASSTSQPATGVGYVQTYADGVFNYNPLKFVTFETGHAQAWLNMWGDGYWSWNASIYYS